jgi:hypothetical protein
MYRTGSCSGMGLIVVCRIQLHAMFSTIPIAELRTIISSFNSSYLFQSVTHILSTDYTPSRPPSSPKSFRRAFSRSRSSSKEKATVVLPTLLPSDLFRSPTYASSLASHLKNGFPLVPLSAIQSIVADGGTYAQVRDGVAGWRARQSWVHVWISDLFVPTSASMATKASEEGYCEELKSEIWTFRQREREELVRSDEKVARAVNLEWTGTDHLFNCGCCFDDIPFEDIGVCAGGQHTFCRGCVGRQVEEHVYGGAPLRLLAEDDDWTGVGGGTGVRCLSIEGCRSPFSIVELERILTPQLFHDLNRRLGEVAVEVLVAAERRKGGLYEGGIVSCPFCTYAEAQDSSVLARAFPIFTTETLTWSGVVWRLSYSLLSLFAFLVILFPVVSISIALFPSSLVALCGTPGSSRFSTPTRIRSLDVDLPSDEVTLFPLLEPHRVLLLAHRFITLRGRAVLAKHHKASQVFHCRNGPSHRRLPTFGTDASLASSHSDLIRIVWPTLDKNVGGDGTCGRSSCLICGRAWVEGLHTCWEDEQEGLRLAVERAMSDAVKRTCPSCGVAFQKESGCNKVSPVSLSWSWS